MVLKLEDLYLEGQGQGSKRMLAFVQDEVHGYGSLDKYEYALGVRRGTLSKPDSQYNFRAPVHEGLHHEFAKSHWALLPEPDMLEGIVTELHKNMRKPFGLCKELSDTVAPASSEGLFAYKFLFFPSKMSVVDQDAHSIAPGTLVHSPVHPAFTLANLLKFSRHYLSLRDASVLEAIRYIYKWETAFEPKALYRGWVDTGWENVDRAVPEAIVLDYDPFPTTIPSILSSVNNVGRRRRRRRKETRIRNCHNGKHNALGWDMPRRYTL
ncbi:hypothetical protein BKA70DRAFT_1255195 [Coprinopsis sp. MPI-PUGE-AT-0042]|nr:hypothetical protein BKA70DRAFT_1255195 [Coprinopsis sp. MPI-PUGE-AT-0042]